MIRLLLILVICSSSLFSIPEYSLFTGNKCRNCHISPSGGGFRNLFGRQIAALNSTFSPSSIGLEDLYKLLDNDSYYIEDVAAVGAEVRYFSFRPHNFEKAERFYDFMQVAANAGVNLGDVIVLDFSYYFLDPVFKAQQRWQGSVFIKPSESLPYLRAGFFEPSIGLDPEDHVSLDRQKIAYYGIESVIPPNYSEPGFEIVYDSEEWLTVNAGMFQPYGLKELFIFGGQRQIVPLEDNPSFLTRFVIWGQGFDPDLPVSNLGASAYVNGKYWMINLFGSVAVMDDLFLILKHTYTDLEFEQETYNYSAKISYQMFKGLHVYVMAETGETISQLIKDRDVIDEGTQIVLGASNYILPNFHLIAEYRFLEVPQFKSMRWVLQGHFYY